MCIIITYNKLHNGEQHTYLQQQMLLLLPLCTYFTLPHIYYYKINDHLYPASGLEKKNASKNLFALFSWDIAWHFNVAYLQ